VRAARHTTSSKPSPLLFAGASLLVHAAAGVAFLPRVQGFHPVAETLVGETIDLEQLDQEPPPAEQESSDVTPTVAAEDLPLAPEAPATVTTRSATRSSASTAGTASATAAAPSPPPLPFGAAGVRYASDLATTFTRSFPQAASSDRSWASAPFGSAGAATVSLVIDENGRMLSTAVLGAPSPALRRGIERTLALIEPRAFTASAAITRLKITARVTRDDVHDGLHGEVFALSGGSFAGDVGSAFFALPASAGAASARRVDVEVRLLP
jgi:hypothetical protein